MFSVSRKELSMCDIVALSTFYVYTISQPRCDFVVSDVRAGQEAQAVPLFPRHYLDIDQLSGRKFDSATGALSMSEKLGDLPNQEARVQYFAWNGPSVFFRLLTTNCKHYLTSSSYIVHIFNLLCRVMSVLTELAVCTHVIQLVLCR